MAIKELENEHYKIWEHKPEISECKNHTNLSIEYTISVLKEIGNKFEHPADVKAITEIIRHKDIIANKIQELKQYLEK